MSHTSEAPLGRDTGGASGECVHADELNVARDSKSHQDCKPRAFGVSRKAFASYPASPDAPSAAHATLCGRGVWERDDAYPHIVRIGDMRVIECRDGIQWILQPRRKSGTWRDLGYFRNRDVLVERSGLDIAALRALPPHHLGREGGAR